MTGNAWFRESKKSLILVCSALLTFSPGSSATLSGESRAPLGALSIGSDPPDAAVYVDGQFSGRTPLNLAQLPAGDHRVRVVKDGYLENGRVVGVSASRPTAVQVKLTRNTRTETAAPQISGGGGGGGSRKWLWIGLAGAGAGAGAYVLAKNRNDAPIPGTVAVSPGGVGMAGVTNFAFTAAGASDPDGDALTYAWDFGDGGSATGSTASHVYAGTGAFTVKVTVSDGKLSASAPTFSVTVARSLAGTWSGPVDPGFASNVSVTFTQSGTSLAGTLTLAGGGVVGTVDLTGSVTGTTYPCTVVFTTSTFTVTNLAGSFSIGYSGNADATAASIVGTITDNSTVQGPRPAAATFRR
jgi:hypothetical protein